MTDSDTPSEVFGKSNLNSEMWAANCVASNGAEINSQDEAKSGRG